MFCASHFAKCSKRDVRSSICKSTCATGICYKVRKMLVRSYDFIPLRHYDGKGVSFFWHVFFTGLWFKTVLERCIFPNARSEILKFHLQIHVCDLYKVVWMFVRLYDLANIHHFGWRDVSFFLRFFWGRLTFFLRFPRCYFIGS